MLYVCDNPEIHSYVSLELKKQNIPLQHIHFKRLVEIQGYPYTATMFPSLIASYDAIFVDEAEDLGSYAQDEATGLDIQTEKLGHFWILCDHLQESTSNAGITIMQWDPSMGSQKSHRSKDTVKLTNIYRSSVKCTVYLLPCTLYSHRPMQGS